MEEEEEDNKIDRLSSLPNDILCRILSNVTTRDSTRTCILSKRWIHVHKGVTTFDLDDRNYRDWSLNELLLEMGSRVDMKKMSLWFLSRRTSVDYVQPRIVNLIEKNPGLESLYILARSTLYLPQSVFNSKILVELNLEAVCVRDILSSSLPSLKQLSLVRVKFDTKSSYYSVLSASSRVLEKLQITSPVVLHPTCDRKLEVFLRLRQVVLQRVLSWKFIMLLITISPSLGNLELDHRHREDFEDEWVDPSIIPSCFSSQFQICNFIGYKGTTSEDKFLKYTMSTSNLLKIFTVKPLASTNDSVKYQWLKKLSSMKRASPHLEFLFD